MTEEQTDRRLATVETVIEVAPIPDADAIERVRVRGWDVVVKKGEFVPGDLCVYFEVDSMLDAAADPRFEFLISRGMRTDSEGRVGHVLKTVKLRGQVSQGLVLPLADFPELTGAVVGDDVTSTLRVWKWDPPIPAQLSGQVIGYRPSWLPKTDQERVQNLPGAVFSTPGPWVATEKIDGASCSIYVKWDPDTESWIEGVCSRNLDLYRHESNTMWRLALDNGVHDALVDFATDNNRDVAYVQGEVYGEGIQSNPLKLKGHHLSLFTVGGLVRQDWPQWALDMSVPVLDLSYPGDMDEALAQADALTSQVPDGKDRRAEGVVWQCQSPVGRDEHSSWKAISNRYLLKNDR